MREVSRGIFSLRKKSKIILLPPNFISWRQTEIWWTLFHYPRLTSQWRLGGNVRSYSLDYCFQTCIFFRLQVENSIFFSCIDFLKTLALIYCLGCCQYLYDAIAAYFKFSLLVIFGLNTVFLFAIHFGNFK